jgi:hypothetical protein
MATKRGVLCRIASNTVAAGRGHVAKVLKGEETLEAACAAVENLLSGSKTRSAPKSSAKKYREGKTSVQKRFAAKKGSTGKTAKLKLKSEIPEQHLRTLAIA